MAKMHVHNIPLLSLQMGFLGILFGLKCGWGCARVVSLAQVSCIVIEIFVAPPNLVGAWSQWQVIILGRDWEETENFHTMVWSLQGDLQTRPDSLEVDMLPAGFYWYGAK